LFKSLLLTILSLQTRRYEIHQSYPLTKSGLALTVHGSLDLKTRNSNSNIKQSKLFTLEDDKDETPVARGKVGTSEPEDCCPSFSPPPPSPSRPKGGAKGFRGIKGVASGMTGSSVGRHSERSSLEEGKDSCVK
jgi:hypothetical protein